MSERFWFYVVTKDEGKPHITAVYDSWAWGNIALKYTDHFVRILKKTDWSNFRVEEMDKYIESILSFRWHMKPKKYFYHRVSIEGMENTPKSADTNYGCVIIDAQDPKDIKASFYDKDCKYMPYKDWVIKCHEGETKFNREETLKDTEELKVLDGVYDRLGKKFYDWLCKEMFEQYQKSETDKLAVSERDSEKNEEGKKLVQDFEKTIMMAEARALSKLSLERPLDDAQYKRFMELGEKLGLTQ